MSAHPANARGSAASFGWKLLLLFLLSLLLNTCHLGLLPLLDRDEPRFAEATREMMERGDWVVPRFNDAPRFDKPPLTYWAQALCYAAGGEDEFTARLPSALAGALTVVVTALLGRSLYGPSAGIWAGIIFGTGLQVLVHSRLAVADMLLVLAMTTAAWAGWAMTDRPPSAAPGMPRLSWLGFHLALAVAGRAEGPVGWLPLVPVWRRYARSPQRSPALRGRLLAGLALMIGLVALWGIPALRRTQGEFALVGLGHHVVGRALQPLEGHGASGVVTYVLTLPYFFVTVFASFFPWSIGLPALIGGWWRREAVEARESYLVTGILLVFGVFTLVRTKLPHYTLPAFPLLSVWLAGTWERETGRPVWAARAAAGMAAGWLALAVWFVPLAEPWFPTPKLLAAARPWLRPSMDFASVDYQEPSLVWSFRRYLREFHRPLAEDQAAAYMAAEGPRLLILPSDSVPRIFPQGVARWHVARVQGYNLVHGRPVDLTLLVKD